jgi:hypothetical protein
VTRCDLMNAFSRGLLVATMLAGCGEKTEPASKPASEPVVSAAPAAHPAPEPPSPPPPYVSAEGRYTAAINFGAPTEKVMNDPQGVPWTTARWDPDDGMYLIQYADFPNARAAVVELEAFKPTVDLDKIKADKPVTVGGRPGRDLEVVINERTTMFIRFVLEGSRLYKVVVGNRGDAASARAFIEGVAIALENPASPAKD